MTHFPVFYRLGLLWLTLIAAVGINPWPGFAAQEEMKPSGGVAYIEAILNSNQVLIDEYLYTITPSTKFYFQNGTTSDRSKFAEGTLVNFVADESGNLLYLREEFDFEGEFQRDKPNLKSRSSEKNMKPEPKRKKANSLRMQNGVWIN